MRKLVFSVANSLDNYIARADGAVDWLLFSDDVREEMSRLWKSIDTVVMGRKTYEAALGLGDGPPSVPGVHTYVLSRTLDDVDRGDTTVVRSDVVPFVRELRQREGKDIFFMGGGEIARPLFEEGLIDEIGLCVHPVLLGNGVPLYRPLDRQLDLELVDCRAVEHGCVFLTYRVAR